MKQLPPGTRILFHSLAAETTEEDIQRVIVERTGLLLPLESISTRERGTELTRIKSAAIPNP
jgi:hypothetical protein